MSDHVMILDESSVKLEESQDSIVYQPKLLETATGYESSLREFIDQEESSTNISVNLLNSRRLKYFEERYTNTLLRVIREQDFEYGFDSMADKFVRQLMLQNRSVTKEWLNRVFLCNFNDIKIVIGLVQILSHIEYAEIYPEGPTMALAVLNHENPEARECGIRAFENWGTLDSLHILASLHFKEKWMQEYVDKVISDLKEEFSLNASSR